MKNFILSCIGILFFTALSTAQDFPMTNGDFVSCSGSFTDSGGITGDYSVNEDFTITFCSPFATDAMRVTFNSFDTQFGDILLAYDGDSNTAPFLGVFQGTNSPGVLEASAANTSGCLTFTFISNSSGTSTGWQAAVECIDMCQTIITDIVSVPAIDEDGILRLCQGEVVDFTGSAEFSNDSTGATYKFRLPDGTETDGTTLQQTFNDPGVYRIDFVATAPDGCRDRSLEDIVIQVSTTPDFTGTQASDTSICFGESANITGMVVATEFASQVAPPVSGVTFLEDIENNEIRSYETCIDVSGFAPAATLDDVTDLLGFYIDIEHSYLGDLDITLTAPNGAVLDVKTDGGTSTFLGVPINDESDLSPGEGFVYNFTEAPSATQTLSQASLFLTTLPEGDYLAEDPFSLFLGTSLNGLWCLNITDSLPLDNGYIFEWGINFNPLIVPEAETYIPGEVSQVWGGNEDITAVNDNVITVTPTFAGQNCYDYIFTDSFGCSYTETVCIDVAPEIAALQPNDIIVCQNTGAATVDLTARYTQALSGIEDPTLFSIDVYPTRLDADAATNAIPSPDAYNVSASETVFIRVQDLTLGCHVVVELNVVYSFAQFNAVEDMESCDDVDGAINGLELFDLTTQDATILGTAAAAEFDIDYFLSQSDAETNSNSITTPDSYQSAGEVIYVRVSNAQDPSCFATGSFKLTVITCGLEVPEGFSPNNDTVNDKFSITGLDQFPNFEMKVFNRLGSLVYQTRANNYVEFAGIPNTGVAAGDGLLPVGTYFYVIKFNDPDTEDIASWMYINY
ncbi:gliding motility-associated C-terminal domain-containing protein [uncultured Nonlabens sp.]|uniref:T9SS type B sorting domain-containing protein n=1 Tax=uncultured Nonlabens sp. TaxID=859306 RepID=UPI0026060B52|nr:gliding motility-associated C-terminal domain-containing protein [uncultured Nonlabens sp.]